MPQGATRKALARTPGTGSGAMRPIEIGGFRLGGRSAVAVGRPTLAGWQAAMQFAGAVHAASPYWVGDLLRHAESRDDWREKLSQAMSVTSLARQTMENLTYVSKHVAEPARRVAPTLAHAAEVAALPVRAQHRWLTKAVGEGWTSRELRHAIRHAARHTVIEGQAATMHTVDVTVQLAIAAPSAVAAQDAAWTIVKAAVSTALAGYHGKVIGAKALPHG